MIKRARDLEHVSVLVVDDNVHMIHLLKSLLNSFRVSDIRTATDGADAMQVLRTFHADLIVTDWAMEPLDGMDFARLLRTAEDSPNPYAPIIMVTGHTEVHRVMEARDAGINEFLAKPVSAQALYSRLMEIIERPRDFVRNDTYFGPSRRRRSDPDFRGPFRRSTDKEGQDQELSQDDVEKLFA